MSAETKTRAKVTFTIMDKTVQVPEGMTLLNAMQVSGHDHLKGCGCRMGDFDRLRALASLHSVRSCAGPLADTYRSGVAVSAGNSGRGFPTDDR